MQTTANYGLKKPEGSDVVDVQNFNDNADIVDTELKKRVTTSDYIRSPGYVVDTGTVNAYVVALNPAPTAYADGMAVTVKIKTANTGASTLNVNSLGAKSILDSLGNALTSGKLKAGLPYTFRYNGTNFILQGEGGEYGTATQADVLNTATFGTEQGVKQGTMNLTNLTPGNVRENVNINGVVGTVPGPGSIINPDKLSAISVSLPKDIISDINEKSSWFKWLQGVCNSDVVKIYGSELFTISTTAYFQIFVYDLKTGEQKDVSQEIDNYNNSPICYNLSRFNNSILLGNGRTGNIYRVDDGTVIFQTYVYTSEQAWTDIDSYGNIFTIFYNSDNPHLRKYSYNDGTLLWEYTGHALSDYFNNMCVVNRTNHYVYVHDKISTSTVYIIDSNTGVLISTVTNSYLSGKIYWDEKNNFVYVITSGTLYKLDPTLTNLLWSAATGGSKLTIGSNGNIIITTDYDSGQVCLVRADIGFIVGNYIRIHTQGALMDDSPNPLYIECFGGYLWFNKSLIPTQYKLN